MFRLDEAQHADVLLFLQELMEQAVAIVLGRSPRDAPGRSFCLWRFTAGQKASDRQHCREERGDGFRGHKIDVSCSGASSIPAIAKLAAVGIPVGRETSRISRLAFFDMKISAVLAVYLQAGLTHLVMLRVGHAFFDQPLIVAPSLLVLIGTGGRRRFVSGRARHRVPAFGFGR